MTTATSSALAYELTVMDALERIEAALQRNDAEIVGIWIDAIVAAGAKYLETTKC